MTDTLPLFLPYQQRWIDEPAPVAFAEKGRQEGFSWTEACRSVVRRMLRGTNHNFMSRTESVAKQFVKDAATFARMMNVVAEDMGEQVVVKDKDVRAHVLKMRPKINGRYVECEIRALSSNPDAARGLRGDFTFDEIAFHRQAEEAFEAALPSALTWGHQVRVMSTHNGVKSFFNQKLVEIRKGKWDYAIHRVTIDDAIADGLAEVVRQFVEQLPERPAVDMAWRAKYRADLKARSKAFDQEYMCVAESEGTSYLPATVARACESDDLKLVYSPADLPPGKRYYAGYDVGRRHDLSVLWVWEKAADVFVCRMLRVLDRQSFTVQARLIDALMSNHAVQRICIDENGLGMQLAEQAKERWKSRVEPVALSGPVKASIGAAFKDVFQDRLARIPAYVDWDEPAEDERRGPARTKRTDTWLIDDLSKTKKEVTEAGNVRLAADSDADGHADGFWAGALATQADDIELPLPPPMARKPVGW